MGHIQARPDYVKRHCFYTAKDWRELSTQERSNAKQRAQRRERGEDPWWGGSANDYIRDLKVSGECEHCGEDRPAALQFHHIDPETKEFSIGQDEKSLEKTKEEVAKCRMLCASCHRVLHANGSL